MSKMAADMVHGGNILRKVVDYFCHLAVKPDFYPQMIKDLEFEKTEFASKIKWLAKDNEDIYNPDYNDMLRVAFMYSFNLISLLITDSGDPTYLPVSVERTNHFCT